MSLAQQLLLRALVARFWKTPYDRPLVRWGTELHDRFMLPHFVEQDFDDVIDDLRTQRLSVRGRVVRAALRVPLPGVRLDHAARRACRAAAGARAVARPRRGAGRRRHRALRRFVGRAAAGEGHGPDRLAPLSSRATAARAAASDRHRGEYVAGVRYRAWQPPSCLHPTIGVHAPLVFDLVDTWNARSLGGCTYHVAHPGGRSYETLPRQRLRSREPAARALLRRSATRRAGCSVPAEERNPDFPFTLDLRRPTAPSAIDRHVLGLR